MTELLKARKVLAEYLDEQTELNDKYNLGNEKYCNGLFDALRVLDGCINDEIEKEADYYGEG